MKNDRINTILWPPQAEHEGVYRSGEQLSEPPAQRHTGVPGTDSSVLYGSELSAVFTADQHTARVTGEALLARKQRDVIRDRVKCIC